MFISSFWVKHLIYKAARVWWQLWDLGRVHPVRIMTLRALEESADFIEAEMPDAIGFDTQKQLLDFSIKSVKAEGHFLEFGVFRGGTIRRIAKLRPTVSIHGFDSFEGLPEGWGGHGGFAAGTFTTGGRLPKVPANVSLHKGWFDKTLPGWLDANSGPVAFIHNDSDLYSSAVTIFELLAPRMQPGTIILFDEFFNYPGWKRHQAKAWAEFVTKFKVKYTFIGYARQQVAVRLDAIKFP